METKFTPGPWVNLEGRIYAGDPDCGPVMVADCAPGNSALCERDYYAEHGEYPVNTVAADQCFDDWAADVADAALKKARGEA